MADRTIFREFLDNDKLGTVSPARVTGFANTANPNPVADWIGQRIHPYAGHLAQRASDTVEAGAQITGLRNLIEGRPLQALDEAAKTFIPPYGAARDAQQGDALGAALRFMPALRLHPSLLPGVTKAAPIDPLKAEALRVHALRNAQLAEIDKATKVRERMADAWGVPVPGVGRDFRSAGPVAYEPRPLALPSPDKASVGSTIGERTPTPGAQLRNRSFSEIMSMRAPPTPSEQAASQAYINRVTKGEGYPANYKDYNRMSNDAHARGTMSKDAWEAYTNQRFADSLDAAAQRVPVPVNRDPITGRKKPIEGDQLIPWMEQINQVGRDAGTAGPDVLRRLANDRGWKTGDFDPTISLRRRDGKFISQKESFRQSPNTSVNVLKDMWDEITRRR